MIKTQEIVAQCAIHCRDRDAFIKQYFHHNASDPHQYHLVLNVQMFNQEDAVNLITDAAKFWMKKTGVSS